MNWFVEVRPSTPPPRYTLLLELRLAAPYVHKYSATVFLARDVIYTSRAYATMSVSVWLSVCSCDGSALAHYS